MTSNRAQFLECTLVAFAAGERMRARFRVFA